jgi:site-specific recombinase XerD
MPGNGSRFCAAVERQIELHRDLRGRHDGTMLAVAAAVGLTGQEAQSDRPRTLLEAVRATLRAKHYSPRTEEAYLGWIRRFVRFHGRRHPRTMGESEVVTFLSSLAVEGHVAASTQNQALSALIFLYGDVLNVELDWLQGLVRAKRPERLPVVLTQEEVRRLLAELDGAVCG